VAVIQIVGCFFQFFPPTSHFRIQGNVMKQHQTVVLQRHEVLHELPLELFIRNPQQAKDRTYY
jgi:hypothetical protein